MDTSISAIRNVGKDITIINSLFLSNLGYGEAIENMYEKLAIINSEFKYNSARRQGGVIFNQECDVCILYPFF